MRFAIFMFVVCLGTSHIVFAQEQLQPINGICSKSGSVLCERGSFAPLHPILALEYDFSNRVYYVCSGQLGGRSKVCSIDRSKFKRHNSIGW